MRKQDLVLVLVVGLVGLVSFWALLQMPIKLVEPRKVPVEKVSPVKLVEVGPKKVLDNPNDRKVSVVKIDADLNQALVSERRRLAEARQRAADGVVSNFNPEKEGGIKIGRP